jgi:hypothetical protein
LHKVSKKKDGLQGPEAKAKEVCHEGTEFSKKDMREVQGHQA